MNANSPQKTINSQIIAKKLKQDKFGKDYLILELENEESIFVFAGKVKKEKWGELKEGQKYEFTIEEGNNGSNLLVDFLSEGDDFDFLI